MTANRSDRLKGPRSLEFAQFAIGLLWLLAARSGAASASQGIAHALHADLLQPVFEQVFLLILLVTGYTALHWVATRNGSIRQTNALPLRPTAAREWQKGTAFGWGLLLITLIPMVVAGDLHPQFWLLPRAWGAALLALAALLLGALATEMAFRGFLFKRLIETTGPVTATIVLSLVYAFMTTTPVNNTPFSFLVAFVSGVLFCVAYLRTRALWLGWGIRFGWLASMGVLFGLPLAGSADFASVVATDSSGRVWLTGGAYGPEGAVFTGLVLLGGVLALYPADTGVCLVLYPSRYRVRGIPDGGWRPPPRTSRWRRLPGPSWCRSGGCLVWFRRKTPSTPRHRHGRG